MENRLTRRVNSPVSCEMPVLEQERQLLQLATANRWPFRVLGVAPVPTEPVYHNKWWILPLEADKSKIPARALERVRAIYEAGIRPKAWVVLHEAVPQLPAPEAAPKVSPFQFWAGRMAQNSLTLVRATGFVLEGVVAPLLMGLLQTSLLATFGLVSLLLVDPCLVAVTDDDVWIVVDSWMA